VTTQGFEIDPIWSKARPDAQGLVACVVQDVKSRRVLMLAWVSKDALERSLATGFATFWSRSRQELWEKGATSGNRQRLFHVRLDCDGDTLIYMVEPQGPACHEGYDTCFSWRRVGNGWIRDPEPVDYPVQRPSLARAADLVAMAEAATRLAQSRPKSALKAIRVGAEVESRARAFASALQLKQETRLAGIAAELVEELVHALEGAGVPIADLRAAIDAQMTTVPSDPAKDQG
jgi:phosphoribosyl-AMP cyclohydrolase